MSHRFIHLDVILGNRFKQNAHGILLATDVAARGLDIPSVEMVIHYDIPTTSEVSNQLGSN